MRKTRKIKLQKEIGIPKVTQKQRMTAWNLSSKALNA